ncbi:hypothetical protein EGW08_005362 [Elysia chlorotica]|uniref:Uncharacterized protein n=1 Tax=Elysia chlorotica TaxID=188477 RepID=A0A3S0ZZI6_ELYCH|nr:hypothetical protein EGW08_005362 [Elysia chlorotica]
MNEENDTGKHEFNFFLDKQIQEQLLEADELITAKETANFVSSKGQVSLNNTAPLNTSNVSGASKNPPSKLVKDSSRANLSGWCSSPGIAYRKTESDVPSRARTQQGTRDALSRDSRFRPQTHNPQDFVFRHYSDPRKYIEQYRKEHSCYDTTTTSATRSEFLDTRRFYAYNQFSPLAVGAQNGLSAFNGSLPSSYQEQATSTPEQAFFNQKKQYQQQCPTLQYTNRREQTKQTINASLRPSNLHKFSKPNTTNSDKARTPDQMQDATTVQDQNSQLIRTGSAKGCVSSGVNGVTLQRNSTSTDIERLSARGDQKTPTSGAALDSGGGNQFLSRKLGQVSSAQTRTLDALACNTPIGGRQKEKIWAYLAQTVDAGAFTGQSCTISGDAQTEESSCAAAWPCPEVRLEHFRRGRGWRGLGRGLGRGLVQPAVTAPQLTFITERDEGRSSWAQTSANSTGGSACAGAGCNNCDNSGGGGGGGGGLAAKGGNACCNNPGQSAKGVNPGRDNSGRFAMDVVGEGIRDRDIREAAQVDVHVDVGAIAAAVVDGGGCSKYSCLQPIDGSSSISTSISSHSSNGSNINHNSTQHRRKLVRAKSEDHTRSSLTTDQLLLGEESVQAKPSAASSSSFQINCLLTEHKSQPPSWRDRVQKQYKTMTLSGDCAGDILSSTSSRWAMARRQEEISSLAHARRIKHLIEQSKQRGGAGGIGVLNQGRTAPLEFETSQRADGQDQSSLPLRVDGQQHAQPRLSHIYSHGVLPGATTAMSGSVGRGANPKSVEGSMWLGVLPSPHPVLPPVRKHHDGGEVEGVGEARHKHHAAEKPAVMGDFLDAQSFFSHGISVSSTSKRGGVHHNHHPPSLQQQFTPPDQHAESHKKPGLSRGTPGPAGTAGRITLATAAVIGEPPQPRLKYTAAFHHKLTGGCLP